MMDFNRMKRVTLPVIGAYVLREVAKDSLSLLPIGWMQFRERVKAGVKDYVSRLKLNDIELIKNHANHSQRVTIFTGDIMADRAKLVQVITASAEGIAGEVYPSANRRGYEVTDLVPLIRFAKDVLDRFSINGVYDE